MQPILIAIMGPTASGKSEVAETVARAHGLRLVNADAFMVYRGLDVGTNKPVNKHDYELLDLVAPTEDFGVGEYVRLASDLLWRIHTELPSPLRGGGAGGEGTDAKSPFDASYSPSNGAIVVGGTGLYVRALFEQYADLMPAPDPALRKALEERGRLEGLEALARELAERSPETADKTDLKNPVRVRRALERLADPRPPIEFELPPFRQAKFVLDPPQTQLDQAIARRAQAMLPAWTAEVRSLLAQGVPKSAPAFRAIGYQSVIGLVEGALSEDQALTRIVADTRNYAKRQRTWLRTEPRTTTVPTKDGTQHAIETIINCPVFD